MFSTIMTILRIHQLVSWYKKLKAKYKAWRLMRKKEKEIKKRDPYNYD
jgi:hypothetical protein